jgi:hypothetical protein
MDRSSATEILPRERQVWSGDPESTQRWRRAHLLTARLLVGAVIVQISLLILGMPVGYHQAFGVVVGLLALALALLAISGQVSRSTIRLSILLPVLVLVQLLLVVLRVFLPVLTGLHGVNALVIFGVALIVAIEAEEEVKVETGKEVASGSSGPGKPASDRG